MELNENGYKMTNIASDNKRIAKNTVYMYIRMFVTMLISLYTSRVVLASLGFEDYGLYNVVGGIIAMFGFLNGALSQTTSRYITFYLGKNDTKRLREVFSTGFYIHVLLAIIIVILAETVGLWYVYNKLVVPEGRFTAAMWLYQFTVITAAANIISVPFNASIISHEKISAYAFIAIAESVLKLIVAISLAHVPFDSLIYYGAMLLLIQLSYNAFGWIYSVKKFEGIRIQRVFDKGMFKEMFGFTGWNLLGNFSYMFFSQGINLMLNFYFGTAVNAARGIAVQVEGVVRSFATNIQTAINPQIVKSYAQEDKQRMFSLMFASSRYCYYLLFLLALPIILEADYILTLWLGSFPEHTVNFLRITLLNVTFEALSTPMFMANLASGKVKIYQICMGITSLVFIPITFVALKMSLIPEVVFLCLLAIRLVEMIERIFIIHAQIGLPRRKYMKEVLFNVAMVAGFSSIIPVIVHMQMASGLIRFLIVGSVCVISVGVVVFLIGMSSRERKMFVDYVKVRILKKNKE